MRVAILCHDCYALSTILLIKQNYKFILGETLNGGTRQEKGKKIFLKREHLLYMTYRNIFVFPLIKI